MARPRKPLSAFPESYDDSKPKTLHGTKKKVNEQSAEKQRVISTAVMEPGRNTCNAKLSSRDGYCKSPGVAPFFRCAAHGGEKAIAPYDVFKQALSFDNALKLQTLMEDVLSMDNELASAKVMLTTILENWQRGEHVLQQFMENTPVLPQEDEVDPETFMAFSKALDFHQDMIKEARKYVDTNFIRAQSLVKTLTDGVSRNHKMKEGNKFTLDVKQIRDILEAQMEVMAENCSGCLTLKTVVKDLRDKFSELNVMNKNTKANKKEATRRAYEEMVSRVQSDIGDIEDAEFEEEDGPSFL